MKNRILLLLPIILLLSCQKDFMPEPVPDGLPVEVSFDFEIARAHTKASTATSYAWENRINSVQYFIFNSNGQLEANFTNTGTGTVTRTITTGSKTIWAVVNVPESRFSGCKTQSEFESREVSLDDVASYSFPMSGSVTRTITAGSNNVTIPVSQLVCRVIYQDIYNELEGCLEGEDIELENIYLTNVVCNSKNTGAAPSTIQWSTKCGRRDNATAASHFVEEYDDVEYNRWTFWDEWVTISWSDDYGMSDYFYFFPNPTTSDRNGWAYPFTPRYTRIVAELSIRGQRYYYPINLNGAQRNHSYDVYLTVTHPGSIDPDTFDWAEIQDVTISIGGFDEWDDDLVITY